MSLGVSCRGLVYIYRLEGYDVVALAGVDLDIAPGESVALLGPSGSGKSTLLSLLAGLLTPSAGRLTVGDHDVAKATEAELQAMRASDVGVVLQGAGRNLLPYLSVEQNVRFAQRSVVGEARRALPPPREVLSIVGLTVRAKYRARPGELSPAERQRLALAVALACRPGLLLADEPTSQLDSRSRDEVVSAFDAVRRTGTTVIVVTHDPEVGARMGRSVTIRDGRVGAEGHSGVDFSVIGRDGSVHLPPEILARFPAGTLLHVQERADGTIVLIPAQAGMPVAGSAGGFGTPAVSGSTAMPALGASDMPALPVASRAVPRDPTGASDTVPIPATADTTSNSSVTATAAVPGQRTFSSMDGSPANRGETL